MQALVDTTEYTAMMCPVSINMQDRRSGLQARVDEWQQGQNSSLSTLNQQLQWR